MPGPAPETLPVTDEREAYVAEILKDADRRAKVTREYLTGANLSYKDVGIKLEKPEDWNDTKKLTNKLLKEVGYK